MPTPRSTAVHPKVQARTAREPSAVQLLKADHAEVKKLFTAYDKLAKAAADAADRTALAREICMKLTVHATIEEEIFYPTARDALGAADDLIDEATVEHASAKDLIAQILSASADDEMYDAKVKVLGEYIDHHVNEEQKEMFPKLARKMDMREVGARLRARKEELLAAQPH